jgi:CheY-like chemotaxis protein
MPVMTGYESTRHIRTVETERRLAYEHQNLIQSAYLSPSASCFPFNNYPPDSSSNSTSPSSFDPSKLQESATAPRLKLNEPALIIALTGFSSQKDQEMAFEAGVDIFMTKPVRFREVGKILEGWIKSRELRALELQADIELGGYERREVDEGMSGAKRSG